MPQPASVRAHYVAQKRQAAATLILARRQWRKVDVRNLDRSWPTVLARLLVIVSSAQEGAAAAGAAYVGQMLADVGQDVDADGVVAAAQFAGWASDGRPLGSLLYSSIVNVRSASAAGQSLSAAYDMGRATLESIVRTQVADAGRDAASVAIAARKDIGWTRYVSAPCCQRCAVLAGKWFRWNQGFQRHPRCDCRHVPTARDGARGLASKVDPADVHDLTAAQRQAIADGADLNQVVNAHRQGARSSDGMTTTAGTSRRRGRARLTPAGIYKVSATRDEAVQRLRANGYLL